MRYTPDHKEKTRARILESAATAFRRQGLSRDRRRSSHARSRADGRRLLRSFPLERRAAGRGNRRIAPPRGQANSIDDLEDDRQARIVPASDRRPLPDAPRTGVIQKAGARCLRWPPRSAVPVRSRARRSSEYWAALVTRIAAQLPPDHAEEHCDRTGGALRWRHDAGPGGPRSRVLRPDPRSLPVRLRTRMNHEDYVARSKRSRQ